MRPYIKNLLGAKFGRLVVIEFVGRRSINNSAQKRTIWKCKCLCGNEKEIYSANLVRGTTRSCGCLMIENRSTIRTTHGKRYSGEYYSWRAIKARCLNENNPSYKDYGGRGITMFGPWVSDFSAFHAYIGDRPSRGFTVERINVNGNYEPGNVKWIHNREQNFNKRKTISITYKRRKWSATDIARYTGISRDGIYRRIKIGMPIRDIFARGNIQAIKRAQHGDQK
jgi:hypothetical protein